MSLAFPAFGGAGAMAVPMVTLYDSVGRPFLVPATGIPAAPQDNPEAREIHAAFVAIDTDGSNSIEWRELQTFLNGFFAPARFSGHVSRVILRAFSQLQLMSVDRDSLAYLGFAQ